MKKRILIPTFLAAAVLLIAPSAGAITPIGQRLQERLPTIQQKKEEIVTQRCTVLTKNIDTRIARFNNNKNRHVNNYNTAKQRLSNLVAQLEQKGYDVSQLKADGQTWDGKIQKFASDYQAFITKLTETKNYACGDVGGGFRSALNQARQQLMIVRQSAVDVRNYYQTVIRPDVAALRSQTPAPVATQQP